MLPPLPAALVCRSNAELFHRAQLECRFLACQRTQLSVFFPHTGTRAMSASSWHRGGLSVSRADECFPVQARSLIALQPVCPRPELVETDRAHRGSVTPSIAHDERIMPAIWFGTVVLWKVVDQEKQKEAKQNKQEGDHLHRHVKHEDTEVISIYVY
jgi:hypothetical protein